jgi:hypothetical protein
MKNNKSSGPVIVLICFLIWTFCLVYAGYLFFDSKLDNLNNMVEVHAHAGYYMACMEETKERYKCMDRAHKYVKEIFSSAK